jgi:1-acyl-sn-glycerol-3-phosphate acyltransferase
MLSRLLPGFLVGAISLFLHTINTFFWVLPILLFALVKLILPIKLVTTVCNYLLNFFASSWISVNGWIHQLSKPIQWQFDVPAELTPQQWYLVIANHQSWTDIVALQKALNGKVPFLKFFLKQELIWVPVLGLAWWALDFPFMRRFSKSYLKSNPHMKGKDFETTKQACEKFKSIPISIMNFAEGTRFTPAKKAKQNSPYEHLLKPKSGGIGYVLTLMSDEIHKLLDVTIDYPNSSENSIGFWDFLCGRVSHIRITAEVIEIPESVQGDYINDPQNRKNVQQWLNQLWLQKDQKIAQLKLENQN